MSHKVRGVKALSTQTDGRPLPDEGAPRGFSGHEAKADAHNGRRSLAHHDGDTGRDEHCIGPVDLCQDRRHSIADGRHSPHDVRTIRRLHAFPVERACLPHRGVIAGGPHRCDERRRVCRLRGERDLGLAL